MSTIKTTNLQHPSAASPNLVLAADGSVSGGAGLGGLVLVSPTSIANSGGSASASGGEVTFTGVSSVSLNGVFTSAYENYRILFYADKSTGAGNQIRLRDNSGDVTVTNYFFATWYHNNGGGTGVISNATAGNSWILADNIRNAAWIELFSPNRNVRTGYWAGITDIANTASSPHISAGGFSDVTQFSGLSLIMSTGTVTGTIRVYGYKNS